MKLVQTKLDGVVIIEPDVNGDYRGFFMESYNQSKLEHLGLKFDFVQDNQSLSVQAGVIRGLHYQLHPKAQTKPELGIEWPVSCPILSEKDKNQPLFKHAEMNFSLFS